MSRSIDAVIPVYRPDKKLERLLEMLAEQSQPVGRVILMNTGDVTFPRRLLSIHPGTELHRVEKEDFDHGGTRRRGVSFSHGEIFISMTQDAMPADRYLVERLVRRLSGNVAAAYARQLPGPDSSELERASRAFNYPETSRIKTKADLETMGIKTFFCSNVCAAYRRDVYEELGGFVPHTIFNEDMIYAAGVIRAGYGIAYEADAQVIHSHNYTN